MCVCVCVRACVLKERHKGSGAILFLQVCVTKESLGWELIELEAAAHLVLEGDASTESDSDSGEDTSSEETEQSGSECSSCDTSDKEEGSAKTELTQGDSVTKAAADSSPSTHAEGVDNGEVGEELLTLVAPSGDHRPGVLEQLLSLNIDDVSDDPD